MSSCYANQRKRSGFEFDFKGVISMGAYLQALYRNLLICAVHGLLRSRWNGHNAAPRN
jgi:hypothetical protein